MAKEFGDVNENVGSLQLQICPSELHVDIVLGFSYASMPSVFPALVLMRLCRAPFQLLFLQ